MKKVSLLILVSMILLLAFTSCDKLPPNVQEIINKIPGVHKHAWTDATCESPKTCECGETEGEALGHTWSEATCESAKTCTVCAAVEGEPNGHQWLEATCESPKTCSVCQATEGDALGHKWTAATCDSARTCSVCKKTDGQALGHKWVDATCTTPKTCSTCNATEGAANGHTYTYECDGWCAVCYEFTNEEAAHSLSHVDAKAPTCTENGNVEYWTCEYCGGCWDNENATGMPLNQMMVIVPAAHTYTYPCDGWCAACYEFTNPDAAHTLTHVDAVAATCTENGNIEYWTCEYCGGCWDNENATGMPLNHMMVVVPASHTYTYECDGWCAVCYEFTNEDAAHKLSHVDAVEPSCEANGNVEYWTCEYCGGCWDNENATGMPLNQMMVIIPASHTYLYECDGWCSSCYEFTNPTAAHKLSYVEAVAPTCTENGNIAYWTCEYCGGCWDNENATGMPLNQMMVVVPAAHTYTYACDGWCAVCYEFTNPDAAHSLSHVEAKAPNCYEEGNIEYWTCEYCGGCWDNEEATGMPLNQMSVKLGVTHSNILHVDAIEPACHYTGNVEYWYCTECVSVWTDEALTQVSNIKNVVLPELGGDVNHVDAVPNSCISGGNIEYWYCDTCEQVWQDEARTQLTNRLNVILPVDGVKHNLVSSVVEGIPTYVCSDCDRSFAIKSEGVYFDGENMDGITIGSYTGTSIGNYRGGNASYNGGANKVVSENGVWKAITDVTHVPVYKEDGSTENGADTQVQVWIPQIKTGFADFNAGNGSVGALSLDLKLNLTAKDDRLSLLLHNSNGWNPENGIRTDVLCIVPNMNEDGVAVGYNAIVWNNNDTVVVELPLETLEGTNWTDWFTVQMFFVMDAEQDIVTTLYYINGKYIASGSYTNTVEGDALSCVYINLNAWEAGSGYYMDNIVFGHTANAHWTLDGDEHVVTPATACDKPATCTCGWVGEALEHDFSDATCTAVGECANCDATTPRAHHTVAQNGATLSCTVCARSFAVETYKNYTGSAEKAEFTFAANGAFALNVVDGQYSAMFAPTTEKPDAANTEWAANGKNLGGQHMFWIPSNAAGKGLQGFSCANNATGIISFKMKTNVDTAFTIAVAKERGAADWSGWGPSSTNLLQIGAYSADGVVVKDVLSGKAIATIPVADGWSELFEVTILVELKADNTATYTFYVNGNFGSKWTGAMNIDSHDIRALYINGWTFTANTGVIMDDIVFGYTAKGHNTLDDKDHVVTDATACDKPATCTCGWVGFGLAHDFADATCTAPKICKVCGATEGNKLPHTVAQNGTTLSCTVCAHSFTIENYLEWNGDGSDSALKNVPNGNVELSVVDGKYEYIFKPATDTAPDFSDPAASQKQDGWAEYDTSTHAGGQLQMWIPSNNRGESTFEGFTCENNSVGLISFKMKTNMARLPDWDTSLTFSVGKPRNASDWSVGAGSWTDDSINIFTVEEYQESGVLLKGGSNGTGILLATIPTEDGWSKWFEVAMLITMSSDGTMNIDYYIDGVLCGSFKRDLTQKGPDGRYLDPQSIEALQLSGWTYAPNTGVMFDDFYFGYTEQGHNTLDEKDHELTETNCGEKSVCSCGWTGYTLDHTFASDCSPKCSDCGLAATHPTTHANLAPVVEDGSVKYVCSDCGYCYVLDGGMLDMGKFSDATTSGLYNKTIENGKLTMLNSGKDTNAQHQFWVPGQKEAEELLDFTNANNAIGVLSFSINAKDHHNTGIEFKVNANRGTGDWGGPTNNGWSESSVGIFKIKPTAEGATSVALTGYNGADLGSIAVTGENGWTGWMDVVVVMKLTSDNKISADYYINGAFFKNITADMVIWTYEINSLYINGRTNGEGQGYELKDFYFGFTLNGPQKTEIPFYSKEIAAEDVTSAALKTIVNSKFKQCDQCTAINTDGGVAQYVLAEKDGAQVEALYVSRTTAWDESPKEHFTEFRFAVNGEQAGYVVSSISFDYKIDGTVETNDKYTFTDLAGNQFSSDAYVQIKTPAKHELAGDNYPELSGTDLVLDGKWHTMTYTFEQPLEIIDILLNLYHFQGELLIANLNVVEYEPPFYTEEIAAEDVTSESLKTIVAGKFKQCDQCTAINTDGGVAQYVLAEKDGAQVEALYVSRTTAWDASPKEHFTEFRFAVNGEQAGYVVSSISFDYKIDGTVETNDKYTFTDLAGNKFSSDAYVQIKTPAAHELAGDNYPELSGTDLVLDGEWHTMTYTFEQPLEIIDILLNLYHFQGELLIANLQVVPAE